jgi:hypothetical protein
VDIRIGAQSRSLRFDFDAVENAERLVGGKELRLVLFTERSKTNVFRIAAAGFSTPKKKVSPLDVKAWIRVQPKKYPELERAVMRAVALHLEETGEIGAEEAKAMGEALGAADNGADGTNESSSQDASDSPPASSDG